MTKTSRPMLKIHDLSTGEVIEREMNDEEFVQYEIDEAKRNTVAAEAEAKAAEKQQILDKLGITAEQAKLLLS